MDDIARRPSPGTIAAQALGANDRDTMGVVPAIHLATTFERDLDNGYLSGFVYGRKDNQSVHLAEAIIAALEGAEAGLLFGSGMAAAAAVLLSIPRPAHIVASKEMYWGLRSWLEEADRHGLHTTFVDMSDLAALRKAVRPGITKLVWIETPSNPVWTITDIEAAGEIAHEADAIVCVDSTVATPILTRPIMLGADIVVHSATKYLNGHSDVVAGCIVTARRDDFWAAIGRTREMHGNCLGAFEAWLLTRGMRTLDVRVRAQSASALDLAEWLLTVPSVVQVLYPGLASHPGHQIARRQMIGGFGGMLSFRVEGGQEAAIRVAAAVQLWRRATSLGGVDSLIEHRSSIEGAGSPCPADLLRLSVGLEHVDDLRSDLRNAIFSAAGC